MSDTPRKPAKPERTRSRFPNPAWVFVFVLVFLSVGLFGRDTNAQLVRYGQFRQLLQAPGVSFRAVKVGRSEIRGEIITRDRVSGLDPAELTQSARDDPGFDPELSRRVVAFRTPRLGLENDLGLQALLDARVGGEYAAEEDESLMRAIVGGLLPMLLMFGLFLFVGMYLLRSMGGSGLGFGRSKHKVYVMQEARVTFEDVAGIDEAKGELLEVVDFLKRPEKYQALGGRIPKGVLLIGPPGTGKTLLAKAVAGEAGVPFFSISGSDFVEMFVGVGASRVRDLFRDAVSKAPCIIFIDELDALGKSRSGNAMGSHEEREQTLNQLLVEMDGFDTNRGVILMAATNRPEILDPALLRPGRFDRTVVVDRPDIDGREAILKVHARNVKLSPDVNLRRVAALTPGSVGADLSNLVNEAALLAARAGRDSVSRLDFDEAIERVAVGLERKSRIIRPEEKHRVAIHEAGHALVACAVPNADPVHKVSIIPRGVGVGGYVLQRPEVDRFLMTRGQLEARIKVALGGTVAEELVFDDISTGASSDLMQVNRIASMMVKEWGMSRLGRIFHRDGGGLAFLTGAGGGEGGAPTSEETAREIDLEVRRITDENLGRVRAILTEARGTLEDLANKLMVKEVIEEHELVAMLRERNFPLSVTAERHYQERMAAIEANGVSDGTPGPT